MLASRNDGGRPKTPMTMECAGAGLHLAVPVAWKREMALDPGARRPVVATF